jgi:diguanylate cyclase (GGDEF)-like protein
LNIKQLTPSSTLSELFRHSFSIPPTTLGSVVARIFDQQPYLPGAIVLEENQVLAMVSRRTFLERLSQPYGLEIFLKRPIQVLLSVTSFKDPLVLPATEPIDQAVKTALQRPSVQLYEPIVVQDGDQEWSLLDFQVLLLAQTQILSWQKEELAQQSQQIIALNNQLTWQANHDSLTQLLNRRAFERDVQAAIEDAQVERHVHVLCYLDLDRFKIVNDTCGHSAGDELLRQVATLLQSGLGKSDLVSRLGGDEFALLLRCCERDQGIPIAEALRQRLENLRFIWQGKMFQIGASIGLVMIDMNCHDLNQVLTAADAACYMAKNQGRNRVYVYQADDRELLLQRTTTHSLNQLQQALDQNRLCLYCQPLVQLQSSNSTPDKISPNALPGSIPIYPPYLDPKLEPKNLGFNSPVVGYEILLRVPDQRGEMLAPAPFIAAAERYNLMHRVDRWVIEHLFAFYQTTYLDQRHLSLSDDAAPFPLYMINLSGETIKDPDFLEFIGAQISLYQIPPQRICFEITETVAITNFTHAERCIRELRRLGCKFALDDFGSGMSSFTYLKHLTVDFIKIDGSFVQGAIKDPLDLGIIKAIHEIGQQIGLKTIAEGIETTEALRCLWDLGIEYGQGYGIAMPMPLVIQNVAEEVCQVTV